ncbi:MAG: hypothetical protein ACI8QS_002975 [Planctomycetota bacterium]|jgi:hypothetical protein
MGVGLGPDPVIGRRGESFTASDNDGALVHLMCRQNSLGSPLEAVFYTPHLRTRPTPDGVPAPKTKASEVEDACRITPTGAYSTSGSPVHAEEQRRPARTETRVVLGPVVLGHALDAGVDIEILIGSIAQAHVGPDVFGPAQEVA